MWGGGGGLLEQQAGKPVPRPYRSRTDAPSRVAGNWNTVRLGAGSSLNSGSKQLWLEREHTHMATATDHSTIISAFDSLADAQRAVQDLINAGIPRDEISLAASDPKGEYSHNLPSTGDTRKSTDGTSVGQNVTGGAVVGGLGGLLLGLGALAIPGVGPIIAAGPLAAALGGALTGAAGGGVIGAMKDAGVPDEDARFYNDHLRSGGAVVTVRATRGEEDRITEVLNRYDAVEVGETTVKSDDAIRTGLPPVAPLATRREEPVARPAQAPPLPAARRMDQGEQVIPIVEEQLAVGKRAVGRGSVRVFSRITETPVQQQITLRDETVTVERHAVNRPISAAEMDGLRDQTIEVTETDEEAVVQKTARVVEEVVVGKQTSQRTETISDTVRRTDVQVENVAATGDDTDFRTDFQTRFGKVKGATYESYAPAYQYGSRMANDAQYKGKSYSQVEEQLKTDYLRNNPNSTWDNAKGAVRYGWEKVSGKR